MTKYILTALMMTMAPISFAKNYLDENVSKYKWNDIEVVFLEDNQYPTYSLSVYFADGALGDAKSKEGMTEMMFGLLDSGTTRYTQKEILDSLEFYGMSKSFNVTHEYSTFSVSGLAKDAIPTMKMICHLFQNVTFPAEQMRNYKTRHESAMNNLVTRHDSLANRIFRELSLAGTPFSGPVDGKKSSVKRIMQKDLKSRMTEFNEKVQKRIYIKGPKSLSNLENVFANDCKWSGKANQTAAYPKEITPKQTTAKKGKVAYLVSVPSANQAQIRVGRILSSSEAISDIDEQIFASTFLGGGFTSRLMQELRVKRGLTYSVGAYASSQRTYGRSGISTFTKNESLAKTLEVIKKTVEETSQEITPNLFKMGQNFILGNYLFSLESSNAFLNQLTYFDHINRDYSEIYEFPKTIKNTTASKLASRVKKIYEWDEQVVLVLGDKSLDKELKEAGYQVIQLDYRNYL